MLELALREGEGPVSIGEIAREQGIPARFLEAILRQLKQAGYTQSSRGKVGGYWLARPAENITAGEVIRLCEGSTLTLSPGIRPGPGAVTDPFAEMWREAEQALGQVYDRTSFAELARRSHRLRQAQADYAI
jgi:Rrf2 family protein